MTTTAEHDMPEYSNLPQPRQQASLASAAAAVAAAAAASSTSFNTKRSRHSSLWSLQDEQEEFTDVADNDMVNYVNDPFGTSAHDHMTQEFPASSILMNSCLDQRSFRHSASSSEALN